MWLHGFDIAQNLIAWVRQLDDEGTVLLVARRVWIGFGHDDSDVCNTGGRAEPLFAVKNPFIAFEYRSRLHTCCVGTCSFFRHGIADALFAIQQWLKKLFFLKICSVLE